MVSLIVGLASGLLFGAALGYAGISRIISRHDEFPGQPSIVATGFLTALFLATLSVMYLLTMQDISPFMQILLLLLAFAAGLTVPLVWIRFALQYTGQRFPTGRRTFIALGLPAAFTLSVVAGTVGIELLSFGYGLFTLSDTATAAIDLVNDYSIAMTGFYLATLLVAGASLVAWTSYSFTHLSNEGGILIGVGFILPWFAVNMPVVADLFADQPIVRVYHAAIGAVVGACAAWLATVRYDLFGRIPAAGTVGREVTVEEMSEPVLVIDDAGRVIDLNTAAERAFGISIDAIGSPLAQVFDGAITMADLLAESGEATEVTSDARTYEPTASELADEYGRLLGHSFVFHDVTERNRREQRIQVMNRVLRHNLRNDLNTVAGYAELLADRTPNPGGYATRIVEMATRLLSIGEKARDIEEVIAERDRARTARLGEVIEEAVEDAETDGDCTVQVTVDGADPAVEAPVLTSVLAELVENACRHNDADAPQVDITTTSDDDQISVQVADNGPGIPDHELEPLQEGAETALEHGSGLGLWLVEWGVETLDGEIAFEANDPRGTVATLRLDSGT